MCGICGIVSNIQQSNIKRVERMTRSMLHRGPDSNGLIELPQVTFGHTRLSIIDLDTRSNQPMTDTFGRTIVFNGEIYNYRELRQVLKSDYPFHTESDTEVILAAWNRWGPSCVEYFIGDWAFAIYDSSDGSTTLSRDRIGVKPMYYSRYNGEFIFASEVRALFEAGIPRTVTADSVSEFIRRGKNELGTSSLIDQVYALSPAHTITIDRDGHVTENTYWGESEIFGARVPDNFDDAVEAFGELFTDAVQLRMHADVPVGICLSGGLDSSLITAVAANNQPNPILTFSGIAPGWQGDESRYSDEVSAICQTRHSRIHLGLEDFFKALPRYVWAQETPTSSVSTIARMLVLERAADEVKVLLDGQGGDELLAGYTRFHDVYRKQWPDKELNIEQRDTKPKSNIAILSEFEPGVLLPRKKLPDHSIHVERPVDSITSMQYSALRGPGLLSLLHTEDRLTMAKSLEGRVPFLDHRLVEFCFSSPLAFRIDNVDKRLARSFASRKNLLPDSIVNRRDKLGFATPYSEMLRNPDGYDMTRRLIDDTIDQSPGVLRRSVMHNILEEHRRGDIDHSKRLFRSITLLMWLDTFKLTII